MVNFILKQALKHRFLVVILSVVTLLYGIWIIQSLPVDVFPDLNKPIVTILTESHGLAPEEVETLVTIPIESAMTGIAGVTRVRSSSGIGLSIVFVEFEWGTDIYRNRQLVAERLQVAQNELPENIQPSLAPITSLMGEIQFVGLKSTNKDVSAMDLRTLADWNVKKRLMTLPGVSQVIVMGGQVKQFQILISSRKLRYYGISLEDLSHALSEISLNTTGGFIDINQKEFLIRALGRVENINDIKKSFIKLHFGKPVLIEDIAQVKLGAQIKRGDASINGENAVLLTVKKQPGTDTITLTQLIDDEVKNIQKTLPDGIVLLNDLFKQSHFIQRAISNVEEAMRDGAIMVAIVLFLFLFNFRATFIVLTAIPLSFVITAIVFSLFGFGINTMTLGGLAIAIGELVDDAIVDVENIFRRLKQNSLSPHPKPVLKVVYEASSEIRNSIIFSTMIVVLVFVPLFALSGIEGRLFVPLGLAYIISLLASFLVSMTVSPVLSSYLLPQSKSIQLGKDSFIVKAIKNFFAKIVSFSMRHVVLVFLFCIGIFIGALTLIPYMGQDFLPKFNEGTLTIGVASTPGISLKASNELGQNVEKALLQIPEVQSITRKTGRAELDEHAEGVYWNEIDVSYSQPKRSYEEFLQDVRQKIHSVSKNVYINIGQPISHRLDHLLSGVRAQIAIKVFGSDMNELRRLSVEITDELEGIQGLVDMQIEPLVLVPQLKIAIDRNESNKKGLRAGTLAQDLEIALNGEIVGQVLEKTRYFDLYVRFDDESRSQPENISQTIVHFLPNGNPVLVKDVASVYKGRGPNLINRENMLRRIVISANTQSRDLASIIKEIQQKISQNVELPGGYFVKYDGQFENQIKSTRMIAFLSVISLLLIFLLLYMHFHSVVFSLQILVNIPLALVGSVVAIYCTERVFSLATLIAFITLCGISSRNGIMMISHYIHLVKEEGEKFGKDMILRGTLERLIPVFMTAFTAVLALTPIVLSQNQPGKEILYPVAVVIVGGLISSTLLDIIVTPALFYKFGKKPLDKYLAKTQKESL